MSNTEIRLADRDAITNISGIRKVFDLASKLEAPINLSIGQPHFDVPDKVKEASIAGIKSRCQQLHPYSGASRSDRRYCPVTRQ